jgi:hypothetical protein
MFSMGVSVLVAMLDTGATYPSTRSAVTVIAGKVASVLVACACAPTDKNPTVTAAIGVKLSFFI